MPMPFGLGATLPEASGGSWRTPSVSAPPTPPVGSTAAGFTSGSTATGFGSVIDVSVPGCT